MRSRSSSSASWKVKSGVSVPSMSALVTRDDNSDSSGSATRSMTCIACCALETDARVPSAASRWNSSTQRCSRSARWMDRPSALSVPRMPATVAGKTLSDSSGSSWEPVGENLASRRSNSALMGASPPRSSMSITAPNRR